MQDDSLHVQNVLLQLLEGLSLLLNLRRSLPALSGKSRDSLVNIKVSRDSLVNIKVAKHTAEPEANFSDGRVGGSTGV